MISLEKLRSDLSKKMQIDQLLNSVEIHADTLDEALADAAVQLQTKISSIEFETIEKGNAGILGIGKKPWTIRAYESVSAAEIRLRTQKSKTSITSTGVQEEIIIQDKDGECFVHYFDSEIMLKVIPPEGKGEPVSLESVLPKIKTGQNYSFDEALIKKFIKKSTNSTYKKIGKYQNNPQSNTELTITVSNDEMSASITAFPPDDCGNDLSMDDIKVALKNKGVVTGISEEKLTNFVDSPIYNTPVIIARAELAENGQDAKIEYFFETDTSKIHANETAAGQIDFKERNIIQNVTEKQQLAKKIPAGRGKEGKTVLGKALPARDGKDIPLPLGKNVAAESDNLTIIAEVSGHVLLALGKISVEPVMEIAGDVSIKTGNINFLGTVMIKGNVDDGFDVKASGDIIVSGTVGNCRIESDGNVVVSLGIMGRDEGYVHAGKSVWAKFIQNTKVEVEENVIASDGIINSNIIANKRIWVKGKRAAIIGGHLFATEDIIAKNIGSNSGGSETILEVGYNPQSKKKMDEYSAKQVELIKELEENGLNIQTLENMKKVRKMLPPDKEENLQQLIHRRGEIMNDSEAVSKEIHEIQNYLKELKAIGKVSASGTIYPGVKIHIRDVREDIRIEMSNITFFLEDGFIRQSKFQAPSEDEAK
ncbi:MAG: FapA family protein [Treponemataceae bacterium]